MQRLIERHPLRRGAHRSRDEGMCAMEMVAWLAGEPHGDEPSCACPVAAALVRACNDAMGDAERNRCLRSFVPRLVNSRGSAALERARGMLVLDCLLHTLLPALLRSRGRGGDVGLLAALPPMRGDADLHTALAAIDRLWFAPRAVRWVLLRALEGMPPARYVTGVMPVLRGLGEAEAGKAAGALLERLISSRCPLGDTAAG
ncbi:MAG TPA: hypothetical protein VFD82_15600 [Planctomycetota bacterium]|nr:hypothetical protein [Planctomycetota bacterium]